jgi:hypothetical protein
MTFEQEFRECNFSEYLDHNFSVGGKVNRQVLTFCKAGKIS